MIPVTIVLRSYNDGVLLPKTLSAISRQVGVAWRLIVMESASSDASPHILQEFIAQHAQPGQSHQFIALAPKSYRSARVLNQACALATTDLIAFINSDAILEQDDVLLRLAEHLRADPDCVGAFARQNVRPHAHAMTIMDHELAFSRRSALGCGASWMSLVVSMIRRDAWLERPFDERLTYAEDAVWSQHMLAAGKRIAYCAEISAEHSHDYTWRERYRRAYGDAAALACMATQPPARTILGGVCKPLVKRCLRDAFNLARAGRFWQAWAVPCYRWPQLRGAWHGARAGWQHWRDPATAPSLQPLPPP